MEAMTIRPLGDRILIRRIAHEEQQHGSIWLPALPEEAPMVCDVIAVGPGARDEDGERCPIPIEPGDRVLIGRWAGTDVHVHDEKYRLLNTDEIIGVVEGDGTLVVME